MRNRAAGFSLLELLLALAVGALVMTIAIGAVAPSPATAAARAEAADVQQRLRVAADVITYGLSSAGAGAYAAGANAPLVATVAPVLPYRFGGTDPDPSGTYKTDTLTLLAVPRTGGPPVGTTYWLKVDDLTATYQLMQNDTTSNADVPVVDHVVALRFEYYGEPQPPRIQRPLTDPSGPWTTYGPTPSTTAVAPFAAGENCVFAADGTATPVPRLPELGPPASAPVRLEPSQLTDGPWCPSDVDPNRWDADLLRIRTIVVTMRVEAGSPMLRGPASALFAHGGTSRSGTRWVPDLEISFQISPPNLNVGR